MPPSNAHCFETSRRSFASSRPATRARSNSTCGGGISHLAGILAAQARGSARRSARVHPPIFGTRDAAVCALGSGGVRRQTPWKASAGDRTGTHWPSTRRPMARYPSSWTCSSSEADFWYPRVYRFDALVADRVGFSGLARRRSRGRRLRGKRRRAAQALREAHRARRAMASGRRSTNDSFSCSRTKPATGLTSCRARGSCSIHQCASVLPRQEVIPPGARSRDAAELQLGLFQYLSRRASPSIAARRLLNDYVLRNARDRDFVSEFRQLRVLRRGEATFSEMCSPCCWGLARYARAPAYSRCSNRSRVPDPYPVRAVTRPIKRASVLWRPYMARATGRTWSGSITTAASGPWWAVSG